MQTDLTHLLKKEVKKSVSEEVKKYGLKLIRVEYKDDVFMAIFIKPEEPNLAVAVSLSGLDVSQVTDLKALIEIRVKYSALALDEAITKGRLNAN